MTFLFVGFRHCEEAEKSMNNRPIFIMLESEVMEYKRIQRVYGLDSNTEYNVEFKKRKRSLDLLFRFVSRQNESICL